jgi:hypothetical protein
LKKLLVAISFSFLLVAAAHAQAQFDAAFGVSTLVTPSTNGSGVLNLNGGAYPAVSADFLFLKHFGVGGEVSWRGSQAVYADIQPYRPILYSVYGIYAPPLGSKRLSAELLGGIGAESTRFYQQFFQCNFTGCTDYTSSNHFVGELGGGLRMYVTKSIFVRPEVRYYFVHNNVEFNTGNAVRTGVSIGYSFRPEY